MNLNELKVCNLKVPLRAFLKFHPRMINHPELGCLRKFQNGGKIEVEVVGFSKIKDKVILHFFPVAGPGIKRFALKDFFLGINEFLDKI